MFFSSADSLVKILVTGTLAYLGLIAMLRFSGKRTLAQMNAFDLVVTVSFGSTLSAVLTSRTTSLADGLAGLALLIVLQLVVAWSSLRVPFIRRLIKSEPRMLYHNGRFLKKPMENERVLKEEILQAARNQGIGSLDEIGTVVLETNGSFSILRSSPEREPETLENVRKD